MLVIMIDDNVGSKVMIIAVVMTTGHDVDIAELSAGCCRGGG